MATSKAAAAEARRQKLLARGGDRLQGILGGLPASNIAERKTEELPQEQNDIGHSSQPAAATLNEASRAQGNAAIARLFSSEPSDNRQHEPGNAAISPEVVPRTVENGFPAQSKFSESPLRQRREGWRNIELSQGAEAPRQRLVSTSSLSINQLLQVASWEIADVRLLLAVLCAICCFTLHNSQAPELSVFWSLWWLFNSRLSLVALSSTMLVIYATQVAVLRQSSHLTNCKHRLELSEQCVQKQQQEHLDSLETSSWIPFALKMIGLAQLERGYHQYSAALQLLGEAASCIAVYLIVYCVLLAFLGPEE